MIKYVGNERHHVRLARLWATALACTLALQVFTTEPAAARTTCRGRVATIVGTPQSETLLGTDNADVIAALGGDDTVAGFRGNDIICGGSGSDGLLGLEGSDVLDGGAGFDIASTWFARGPIRGNLDRGRVEGEGRDRVIGIEGLEGARRFPNVLYGGPRGDVLLGGTLNDRLTGSGGRDLLIGGGSADIFNGGGGRDIASFYFGKGVLANLSTGIIKWCRTTRTRYAGPACSPVKRIRGKLRSIEGLEGSQRHANILIGDGKRNILLGGEERDQLYGAGSDDFLWPSIGFYDEMFGGDGSDTLLVEEYSPAIGHGGSGDDKLIGSTSGDLLMGDGGDDKLIGNTDRTGGGDQFVDGAGNDRAVGSEGHDYFYNGPGDDVFVGGGGWDEVRINNEPEHPEWVTGGAGDDLFRTDNDHGRVAGGPGVDTISYAESRAGVETQLDSAHSGWEVVFGSPFNDTILGWNADEILSGLGGDDVIEGRIGNDILDGGEGTDDLDGGLGIDECSNGETSFGCELPLPTPPPSPPVDDATDTPRDAIRSAWDLSPVTERGIAPLQWLLDDLHAERLNLPRRLL